MYVMPDSTASDAASESAQPTFHTVCMRFARAGQAQEVKRASARNPTVSKSEIDHHFAADPLGELCNLEEDLLQFWVLGKKRLRLLVGRRIGVRHDYEPIVLIWTGLKATEPIADPVFEIDGFQGLAQGCHLVDCPAPVVRDG